MTLDVARDDDRIERARMLGRDAIARLGARPFPLFSHSRMLADVPRLAAYRAAIEALIGGHEDIVDIGTGTGILASYAAPRTTGRVYALDVEASALRLARRLFAAGGFANVQVVESASFGRPIAAEPEVLLTETLGPIGVDEHIVETCYEFCRRYPSVRRVIPRRLEIHAQAVSSRQLAQEAHTLLDGFDAASWGTFDYGHVQDELRAALAQTILTCEVTDATAAAELAVLASFELGRAKTARFDSTIVVPDCDGVLLSFSAELGAGQVISTGLGGAPSHWEQRFVVKPAKSRRLRVVYEPRAQSFDVSWSD